MKYQPLNTLRQACKSDIKIYTYRDEQGTCIILGTPSILAPLSWLHFHILSN